MAKIKLAILGVGNCASSLLQGITYYAAKNAHTGSGLMYWDVGGYKPYDVEVVAAFDVDARKVGKDVAQAIFELPNCTTIFCKDVPLTGAKVIMGQVLDGIAEYMQHYDQDKAFVVAKEKESGRADIVEALAESKAEILLNYLPVGSEEATKFYVECCLEAGVAFINCMPVFIASQPEWAARFKEKNIPIIGDDIKAQIGATITHRALAALLESRGVNLEKTYQLNIGGNTDFLNMLDRSRLSAKKKSKTDSVQSVLKSPLQADNIQVGPSDFIIWQKDNKVCYIRMEGTAFGGVPMNLELRLSVEDSPNSAGIVIDAIRCCKLALDRGTGGALYSPSAYLMKYPPHQLTDDKAKLRMEEFISGKRPS